MTKGLGESSSSVYLDSFGSKKGGIAWDLQPPRDHVVKPIPRAKSSSRTAEERSELGGGSSSSATQFKQTKDATLADRRARSASPRKPPARVAGQGAEGRRAADSQPTVGTDMTGTAGNRVKGTGQGQAPSIRGGRGGTKGAGRCFPRTPSPSSPPGSPVVDELLLARSQDDLTPSSPSRGSPSPSRSPGLESFLPYTPGAQTPQKSVSSRSLPSPRAGSAKAKAKTMASASSSAAAFSSGSRSAAGLSGSRSAAGLSGLHLMDGPSHPMDLQGFQERPAKPWSGAKGIQSASNNQRSKSPTCRRI
eukprot:TRINITY_DN49654_c0_g1_i1.p1 TRINITY_DN49654_c0_g1~~TRINITY_DN49654_c0_g1_i1.p1  ORF type:complete len:330 (-),score=75.91 TRINITY_DN49654_c0_g1_i1:64-981(-)